MTSQMETTSFAGFEPLIVPPTQHDAGRNLELTGERRLMAAVLADAIQLYLKHRYSRSVSGQILFRETESWIERVDRRGFLSFEHVCETLHVDGGRLRQVLRAAAAPRARPALASDAGRLRVARGRKMRV